MSNLKGSYKIGTALSNHLKDNRHAGKIGIWRGCVKGFFAGEKYTENNLNEGLKEGKLF